MNMNLKKNSIAFLLVFCGAMLPALVYAKDIIVTEKDFKYFNEGKDVTGSTIDASKDDVLQVVNEDSVEHNVTVTQDGITLNDSLQKPKTEGGKEISIPLNKIGKVNLKCTIHPTMTLDINVKEPKP